MSIIADRKPSVKRAKPARFVNLVVGLNADGANGVIRIREVKGKRNPVATEDRYFLSRVPSDFGQAFYLEKIGAEAEESRYHVNLGADGTGNSCECRGHLRWGHKTPCRHVGALLALRVAGKL
jgi:hypothetical protein